MPENTQDALPSRSPILDKAEVTRRMILLTRLQGALAAHEIQSVLARCQRLVLRSDQPIAPSGLTDPQLHIFGPDGTDIATTDRTTYHFASGPEYPVSDPAGAAIATLIRQPVRPRA